MKEIQVHIKDNICLKVNYLKVPDIIFHEKVSTDLFIFIKDN